MQPASVFSEASSVSYSFTYRFKYNFTKTKAVYSGHLTQNEVCSRGGVWDLWLTVKYLLTIFS